MNYCSNLRILVPSLTGIVSSNKKCVLKMKFSYHCTGQKISVLFPGRPFSPNNSLSGRNFIQVSYKILFVCFGHEDPLSLQLLRILESNNANIPYTQLSYNMDFKARQGKIGKKYTSSPSHVIELSIPYHAQRENNWQCNFAYLCKLSLLSLSFTIPHKQQCTLSYSVGVLLPPLKSLHASL